MTLCTHEKMGYGGIDLYKAAAEKGLMVSGKAGRDEMKEIKLKFGRNPIEIQRTRINHNEKQTIMCQRLECKGNSTNRTVNQKEREEERKG